MMGRVDGGRDSDAGLNQAVRELLEGIAADGSADSSRVSGPPALYIYICTFNVLYHVALFLHIHGSSASRKSVVHHSMFDVTNTPPTIFWFWQQITTNRFLQFLFSVLKRKSEFCSEETLKFDFKVIHVTLRGRRRVGEPPPEDGSVCAGADQGAVVGADLDAGDAAAVTFSYVGDYTLRVVPHLHQLVISTCRGEKMPLSSNKQVQRTKRVRNSFLFR